MDNRADKQKADGGGGAVDDLTPPTMKYGPGGAPPSSVSPGGNAPTTTPNQNATLSISGIENTQVGMPATQKATSGPAKTEFSGTRGASPTIGANQIATVVGDVLAQDLSTEKLLRDAPRVESSGRICPSLNGIPLLAKLGQGGMGAVYYGIHPRLRSEVAVKVLPFHLAAQDPGMIQRFFREAQIAAKVRSPHLVSVIDVNEESGLFFLVMEYVPGVTMGQYIKQLAEKQFAENVPVGMPELDAIDVVIAASMGLDAAHSNGIVHRDLKPENIMVPYKSRQQRVYDLKHAKLMDLGLARSEEGQQSLTGGQAAMGTPGYMAPEQALDAKTADKRSDIFGMGATLYALLSGRPPFKGDAVMKVLMATMHEPHEPIGAHRPDISAALAEVIDHCLDKRPENRYADAHQLMRALKNCRRLIAPDSSFEFEEDNEAPALSGTTPFSPRGTATPNVPGGMRAANASYARAGAALSTPMGQPAVKKFPLGALLAAGVALLAILGVVAYKFLPRGGDSGTTVVKLPEAPSEIWQESRIRGFQKGHAQFLANARTAIDIDNDPDAANDQLNYASGIFLASSKNLPKNVAEQSQKDYDEVKNKIAAFTHEKTFLGALKSIQSRLDEDKEDKVEEAAKLLKSINPVGDQETVAFERKAKAIDDKRTELANKRQAALDLAAAQKPGMMLNDAWALTNKAIGLDPTNSAARDLLEKLSVQKKIADDQKMYDDNMAEVRKALGKAQPDYDRANDAVMLALKARVGDKDAQALETQINAQLGEKKRAEKALQRERDYIDAFGAANDFFKAKKGVEAQEKIALARQYSTEKDLSDVAQLERDIKLLVKRQDAEKLALRIKGDYDGKMLKAGKMLQTDDPESFVAALEYANDAARLLPGTPEAAAAGELAAKIDMRKLEWDNLKAHNLAVSSARQSFLAIKEDNPEAALKNAESALKKVDDALAILSAGKVAVDQLKEPKAAQMLRDQIAEKQKVLTVLVEKRRQFQLDYSAALVNGDVLFQKNSFSAALTAYQNGKDAATALGYEEKNTIELKVNKATAKVNDINKQLAAVDALVKDDRFEDAKNKLSDLEKNAVDARFESKKAEITKSIAALDELEKKRLKDAQDALSGGKFAEALNILQTEADAHKSFKEIGGAAKALKSVQAVTAAATTDADAYERRFGAISAALGSKLSLYQKDFKAAVTGLRAMPATASSGLAANGLGNAAQEVANLKSAQSKLSADADKNLLKMEEFVRNTTAAPINTTPNTNTGGSDSPSKINKFD